MSKARDIADLDFNSPDIDGGNIDGATIGATTPAAGSFSSLSTTGQVTVTQTHPTLFLQESGGGTTNAAYLQKYSNDLYLYNKEANGSLFLGTNNGTKLTINHVGNATFAGSITSASISCGALTSSGEIGIAPSSGTAKLRLTSQGAGSEVFSVNGQIPGVSNTGFAIRNETDSRNDFFIDGAGGATFNGPVTISNAPNGNQRHFFIDAFQAEYDFRSNSSSGYITTFNMDDNGLEIGHNSGSRTLSLQTNTTDRLTILGTGDSNFHTNNITNVGNISSSGRVEGASLRATVGTDFGSQLSLFADASGHCFIAGHTLSFNVGANNGRTTKLQVDSTGRLGVGSTGQDGRMTVFGDSTTGDMIARFQYSGNSDVVKGIRVNAPDASGNQIYGDFVVDPGGAAIGFGVGTSSGNLPIGKNDLAQAEIQIHAPSTQKGNSIDTHVILNTDYINASKAGSRITARVMNDFHLGAERCKDPVYQGNSNTHTYRDGGSAGFAGYEYGSENFFPLVFIPYSPNQVYRLSASLYQYSVGGGHSESRHYLGVAGYDENFNFISVDGIGTYQYNMASNSSITQGNFMERDITLKGWQGAGQTDGNKMDEGTVYIRPLALLNYQRSGCTCVLTGFNIYPAATIADNDTNAGTNY